MTATERRRSMGKLGERKGRGLTQSRKEREEHRKGEGDHVPSLFVWFVYFVVQDSGLVSLSP